MYNTIDAFIMEKMMLVKKRYIKYIIIFADIVTSNF